MPVTISDGPDYVYGNMGNLPAGFGAASPDPNLDAGPSMLFQGDFYPDVRFWFPKDKVQGYTGVVPGFSNTPQLVSSDQIPAAFGTAKLAALQNVTNGTAMTLVTAQGVGIAPGLQIRVNTLNPLFVLNGGAFATVVGLDFGFQYCTTVAASATITVADTTQFSVGMPLVIGGAGNAAGTTALYTNVLSILTATTLTVGAGQQGIAGTSSGGIPLFSGTPLPCGTGNYWGPSENGFPTPDAVLPALAGGPALLLDGRQSLQRCVSVSGVSSGTGGVFQVQGYDLYNQAQTENITVAAGANTVYGKKTWKYIAAVVPQFTDAHNYSVGTGDTFGFAFRSTALEFTQMYYNGTLFSPVTGTATGWLTADLTSPATLTTGDVRGTWQVSANGNGTAWAGTGNGSTTGSIVSLQMSGLRLMISQILRVADNLYGTPNAPASLYGVVPK